MTGGFMAIEKKEHVDILKIFKKEKVMTLKELGDFLNCCKRTVQRRLSKWRAYTSYNQNGRYYTLQSIPKFDEKGLWKYKGIFFSNNGNLKQTIAVFVIQSTAGLTVAETSKLVGVNLNCFLSQGRYFEQLHREKVFGRFVYFSSDEAAFIKQKQKRQENETQAKLTRLPTDTQAVIILVGKIKHPKLSIEQLCVRLRRKGHRIKCESIRNLFECHDLIKKTVVIRQ